MKMIMMMMMMIVLNCFSGGDNPLLMEFNYLKKEITKPGNNLKISYLQVTILNNYICID